MVGVQLICTEIPMIHKTLKSNRTKILARRYEKMFHFPKQAKPVGDLKLCNSLQEDFGPRRSWFLLVLIYDSVMFCAYFFIPILWSWFFPSVFFCGLSHLYLCHSQISLANIGKKISLFINSQVSPETCQTRCWLALSPALPLQLQLDFHNKEKSEVVCLCTPGIFIWGETRCNQEPAKGI